MYNYIKYFLFLLPPKNQIKLNLIILFCYPIICFLGTIKKIDFFMVINFIVIFGVLSFFLFTKITKKFTNKINSYSLVLIFVIGVIFSMFSDKSITEYHGVDEEIEMFKHRIKQRSGND